MEITRAFLAGTVMPLAEDFRCDPASPARAFAALAAVDALTGVLYHEAAGQGRDMSALAPAGADWPADAQAFRDLLSAQSRDYALARAIASGRHVLDPAPAAAALSVVAEAGGTAMPLAPILDGALLTLTHLLQVLDPPKT